MTDVGAVLTVDPLIGDVVIRELALADEIPIKVSMAKDANNCAVRVIFTEHPLRSLALNSRQSSHFFRLSIYPFWVTFMNWRVSAYISICM